LLSRINKSEAVGHINSGVCVGAGVSVGDGVTEGSGGGGVGVVVSVAVGVAVEGITVSNTNTVVVRMGRDTISGLESSVSTFGWQATSKTKQIMKISILAFIYGLSIMF